jgi:hypothetical protein
VTPKGKEEVNNMYETNEANKDDGKRSGTAAEEKSNNDEDDGNDRG